MLYVQENQSRQIISLDGIWRFKKDKEEESRPIAVPASWNEQYEDLYNFHGKGIYERSFFVPAISENDTVLLRFGSVSGKTEVLVNGYSVLTNEGAALPFEADIKGFLNPGENILTVISDNTLDPWAIPPAVLMENEERVGFHNSYPAVTYDFFPYSGIHRSVSLCVVPVTRIEDITIKTKLIEKENARISYRIVLTKAYTGKIEIKCENICEQFFMNGESEISGSFEMEQPKLWDVGKPNLYSLDVTLYDRGGNITDTYYQKYGVREVAVRGEKFFLNGKEIFFKGFGKHEDFHIIGKGFFAPGVIKDFSLMKKLGANSFRTSHYPYDEQMLSLADELGFLVISEAPMVGLNDRMYRPDILKKANERIRKLIGRDKNHPSVIAWSLANEPCTSTDAGVDFFKSMAEMARECDDTRPITYAAHYYSDNNVAAKYYDFICLNRYCGWYVAPGQIDASLPSLEEYLEEFHTNFEKPILVTEFGADAIAGMHAAPPVMFSEEYQSELLEKQYRLFRSKEYVIGAHIWAFADFRTAQSISRIIDNRKGIFTRSREPKLSAITVQNMWKNDKDHTGR